MSKGWVGRAPFVVPAKWRAFIGAMLSHAASFLAQECKSTVSKP